MRNNIAENIFCNATQNSKDQTFQAERNRWVAIRIALANEEDTVIDQNEISLIILVMKGLTTKTDQLGPTDFD
jgi:hypothetical protein